MQRPPSAHSLAARFLARANRLWKRPDRPRYFETEAYQAWLETHGRDLVEQFYSKHARFQGLRVLDVGCGYGGKIAAYGSHQPGLVCGLDIDVGVLREAQTYSRRLRVSAHFTGADAVDLPFRDGSFDIVISDDGFDHFMRPARVLDEMLRVLKPDGTAFVTFVPYYSKECSHMGEYLRVPWHHVFFSRSAVREALDLVAKDEAAAEQGAVRTPAESVFATFASRLSRLSLRGFKRLLLGRDGVRIVRFRKQSADWARLLTYVPLLNELVTDCVLCVLRKDASARIGPLAYLRQAALDFAQDLRGATRRIGSRLRGKGSGIQSRAPDGR